MSYGKGLPLTKEGEENIDRGKEVLEEAISKGIFRFNKDEILNDIFTNVEEAERKYGKIILEFLTGNKIEKVKKNYRIPEFRRMIEENVSKNLRFLRKNKVIDRYGFITEDFIEILALKILEEEKNKLDGKRISYVQGLGKDIGVFSGEGIRKKGEYRNINVRKTIREYVKRKKLDKNVFRYNKKISKKNYELLIILDISGSMKGIKIKIARRAASSLILKALEDDIPVGLILFNDKVVECVEPNKNYIDTIRRIFKFSCSGSTDISSALKKSLEILKSKGHIIVLTDASPNVGEKPIEETLKVLKALRDSQVPVSIIWIDYDEKTLEQAKKFASEGGGKLYLVKDLSELGKIVLMDYETFLKK